MIIIIIHRYTCTCSNEPMGYTLYISIIKIHKEISLCVGNVMMCIMFYTN